MDKNTYIIIGLCLLIVVPLLIYIIKKRSAHNEIKQMRLESMRSPQSPYQSTTAQDYSDSGNSSDDDEWRPEAPENSTMADLGIDMPDDEIADEYTQKSRYLMMAKADFILEPKKKYSVTILPRSLNCAHNIQDIKIFTRKKSKLINLVIHGYDEPIEALHNLVPEALQSREIFNVAVNVPIEDPSLAFDGTSEDEATGNNEVASSVIPSIVGNVRINGEKIPGENKLTPLNISRVSIRRLDDQNYSIRYPRVTNAQQTLGDSLSVNAPSSTSGAIISKRAGTLKSLYIESANNVSVVGGDVGYIKSGDLRLDVY